MSVKIQWDTNMVALGNGLLDEGRGSPSLPLAHNAHVIPAVK